MTEIRNSKQYFVLKGFWSLNIGICDLFVIWCLEFVILDTKLQCKRSNLKNGIYFFIKLKNFRYV
jgi:hypothetical protein